LRNDRANSLTSLESSFARMTTQVAEGEGTSLRHPRAGAT
jgi:hypothetical protein